MFLIVIKTSKYKSTYVSWRFEHLIGLLRLFTLKFDNRQICMFLSAIKTSKYKSTYVSWRFEHLIWLIRLFTPKFDNPQICIFWSAIKTSKYKSTVVFWCFEQLIWWLWLFSKNRKNRQICMFLIVIKTSEYKNIIVYRCNLPWILKRAILRLQSKHYCVLFGLLEPTDCSTLSARADWLSETLAKAQGSQIVQASSWKNNGETVV